MATKWGDLEPEYVLLGGVLRQACRDALQTAKPALSVEAWEFLQICAPTVADRLSNQHQNNTEKVAITDPGSRNMASMQLMGASK